MSHIKLFAQYWVSFTFCAGPLSKQFHAESQFIKTFACIFKIQFKPNHKYAKMFFFKETYLKKMILTSYNLYKINNKKIAFNFFFIIRINSTNKNSGCIYNCII